MVKSKLSPFSGSVALRQLNPIHKRDHMLIQVFFHMMVTYWLALVYWFNMQWFLRYLHKFEKVLNYCLVTLLFSSAFV